MNSVSCRNSVIGIMLVLTMLVAPSMGAQVVTTPPWREPLPAGRDRASIVVGESQLVVDLAITPEQQQLGLGFRNGMGEVDGMLFVGDQATERSFWMKGMRFCLDIIWINNGQIVGAAENACPDPEGTVDMERKLYPSGVPVTHVLEMPAGWLADNHYGEGTPVDLSGVPPLQSLIDSRRDSNARMERSSLD